MPAYAIRASTLLSLSLYAAVACAGAQEGDHPWALFAQWGDSARSQALTLGALWRAPWRQELGRGSLNLYLEGSVGRWRSSNGPGRYAWVTQAGITPVIRWDARSEGAAWFAEVGIGANVIAPIFHENGRSFSTNFNFGDHIGVGCYLDPVDSP